MYKKTSIPVSCAIDITDPPKKTRDFLLTRVFIFDIIFLDKRGLCMNRYVNGPKLNKVINSLINSAKTSADELNAGADFIYNLIIGVL